MGIALAVLIILQAGTGLILTLGSLSEPYAHAHSESADNNHEESMWEDALETIHHGGGAIGTVYRIVVGAGLLGMAVSGVTIFSKIKARTK